MNEIDLTIKKSYSYASNEMKPIQNGYYIRFKLDGYTMTFPKVFKTKDQVNDFLERMAQRLLKELRRRVKND